MTTSVLENIRQYHEDIEISEKVASRLLSERGKKKPKFRPIYDHAIQETLLRIQDASRRVLELYVDKDALRKDEIVVLGGQKRFNPTGVEPSPPDSEVQEGDETRVVWLNFYDQLRAVKEYHRVHSSASDDAAAAKEILKDVGTLAAECIERCNTDQIFTADEQLGRRVDMLSLFLEYTNIQKLRKHREDEFMRSEVSRIKKRLQTIRKLTGKELQTQLELEVKDVRFQEMDYITYLTTFDDFRPIPRHCKYRNALYEKYLHHVLDYLQGFLRRLNPITNHDKVQQHLTAEFETAWQRRTVPAWEMSTHDMPLYCIPTDHIFASEAVMTRAMQGKKYKKAVASMQSGGVEAQQKRIEASEAHDKGIARLEHLISRYKDVLSDVVQRTIESLQKKQSRTLRELELEGDESEGEEEMALAAEVVVNEGESDAESDEGRPVYNPLNLPLGWDGKPIPFWLYKLHGLGIEYKCEICGNYSYWGRRAFERHFQEWRHAFGMRCLKIPNTVHFKEITKIEDAVLLYEQLKHEAEGQRTDQEVECEDVEGNVMSARAYEDLRRQGLL